MLLELLLSGATNNTSALLRLRKGMLRTTCRTGRMVLGIVWGTVGSKVH